MKYRVYRIENNINRKYYYGVHKLSKKGYFGGGKYLKMAIKKYGKENFTMRTIKEFMTEDEAYAFESIMVDDVMVSDVMSYNATPGGRFNASFVRDDAYRKKMSEAQPKRYGKDNPMYGKKPDNSILLLDYDTGVYYESTAEAGESLGLLYGTSYSWFVTHPHRNKSSIMVV